MSTLKKCLGSYSVSYSDKNIFSLAYFWQSSLSNHIIACHVTASQLPYRPEPCLCSTLGNASPFAIRSTSYCVPCEGQTALLSRLPLGALVTPLAKQNAGEVSF